MTTQVGQLWSAKETAARLRIDINTLYSYVAQNAIPYVRVGKLLRFSEAPLVEWLNRSSVAAVGDDND